MMRMNVSLDALNQIPTTRFPRHELATRRAQVPAMATAIGPDETPNARESNKIGAALGKFR
jgi:hypothetical protein